MYYISRFRDWLKSWFWHQELEISIVGIQNAGKTTFVNTLTTSEFDENTIPTVGFNHREVKKGSVQLKIWDIGGQHKYRSSWEKYCRNVDCIIFIVDSADFGNLDVARTQLHKLMSWPSLHGIPLLVLGNKNDLEGALNEEELIVSLGLRSLNGRPVTCYSVSAKNQVNMDITMRFLVDLSKNKKKD
ncbi:unnamed protein product [Blepharisma stoltei]|uniref:Uncharacterized protein n=1 Tax=Blepharisma stoltei TaxID=1481888 RepID=A0AAU9JJ84_9CILI|nr:unnamed protein product [Blepharisma stoltei]